MQISTTWACACLALTLAAACGAKPGDTDAGADSTSSGGGSTGLDLAGDGSGNAGSGNAGSGNAGSDLSVDGSASGGGAMGGAGPVCERATSGAEAAPVFLGFAFDVSGSMGKLDSPNWWHDPTAKWEPVALATSAFFENPASSGLQASMTLFPTDEDDCESSSYLTPTVPMTGLPSASFGSELAAYEAEVGSPLAGGDWRGGTPTYAAILGVSDYLETIRADNQNGRFALVLVTDGLPQGCDEELADVVGLVEELAAAGTNTYVIGIENPTVPPPALPEEWDDWGECDSGDGGGDTPCTPPTTLQALNDIAAAGATGSAFLIDTGDPAATEVAFQTAIEAIRSKTVSCSLTIPPHPQPGMSFEGDKIDVTANAGGVTTTLPYDETCAEPLGWHFDDPGLPTQIELCDSTCASVQAAADSTIEVNFLCEARVDVVK
jgi:hypothetical protein